MSKTSTKSSKSKKASSASAKSAKTTTKVTKAKVKKPSDPLKNLRNMHIISGVLFLLLAITAGALMKATTFPLTIGYWTKNELASSAGTVLAPAIRSVYDIQLRWVVVATLVLSAIIPLLFATRFKKRYETGIKNEHIGLRWADLAITTALIVETIAILSAVTDIFVLKLIAGLMVATCALGWLAERQNLGAKKPVKAAFYISLFTGFLPWILIAAYAIATPFYGKVMAPWYVYALYATTLLSFSALALNQWFRYRGRKGWTDYVNVERNYVLINLVVKFAFGVILIAGFFNK